MRKMMLTILTVCLFAGPLAQAGAIHDATVSGDRARVEAILTENPDAIESKDHNGLTPLFVALDRGRNSMARFLIEKGADINVRGFRRRTLLHAAARVGNAYVSRLLVERGADVNALDSDGKTPLQLARHNALAEIVELLATHGAKLDVRDENGTAPLTNMVIMNKSAAVQTLLDHGADPNQTDENWGRSPLHWAALKGFGEAAGMLLNNGATVNAKNTNGHTPLDLAIRYGHRNMAELLQTRGGIQSTQDGFHDPATALTTSLSEGEAYVWYLGHCGFAIKTTNHLLIFDFLDNPLKPDHPSLANGCIDPSELSGQNVYVFVTHAHSDHFDPAIFGWADHLANITYIYGFDPNREKGSRRTGPVGTEYNGPVYEVVGPRQQRAIDNLQITTIESVDAGVGFLVKVDGLEIYHAGDHAGWRTNDKDKFTLEIDYLAQHSQQLDFAFVNATGCHTHCDIALASSAHYTLQKLSPVLWFPTHAVDQEYKYREFAQKVGQENYRSEVVCAQARGDCFLYRNGEVK